MRRDFLKRGGLLLRNVAGAAVIGLIATLGAKVGGRAMGAETPVSLAQTISYDAAEVVPGAKSSGASLSEAVYQAPLTPEPMVAGEVDGSGCSTCNGGGGDGGSGAWYGYNRCGCSAGLWPYFTGPGTCDNWCVGPHWEVALDALILSRESIDWGRIAPGAGFAATLLDQFNTAPGARLFVTGYNENRFGMQVGYEGVNDFHANAVYTSAAASTRQITYESRINSVEMNFMRKTDSPWRPFVGARFIELDEDFVDFTTVNKPIPAPVAVPVGVAFVDTGRSMLVDNRLIGVQGGVYRDVWHWNQWFSIEPFGNAGIYMNDFRRREITRNVTTVITGDDVDTPGVEFVQSTTTVQTVNTQEFSDVAFTGEAGITGVLRLSPCVALRAGYQVLVVDNVGQGIDGFLAPGLNGTNLFYHGGHFGIEYVR